MHKRQWKLGAGALGIGIIGLGVLGWSTPTSARADDITTVASPVGVTAEHYLADSPADDLPACPVSTRGAESKTYVNPEISPVFVLTGDSMTFAGATRNCAQASSSSVTSDSVTYAPPGAQMIWSGPTGPQHGTVSAHAPECPDGGTLGCTANQSTSKYTVTGVDPISDSGAYQLAVGRSTPPPSPSVVADNGAASEGSQFMVVLDPKLKLEKYVCLNSAVPGGDATTAGGGCDPADASKWVPSQLVPVNASVTWKLVATNIGNVDLEDIAITSDTSAPTTDTSMCTGPLSSANLASGATINTATGAWSATPNAAGEWPGGESAYLVCTTQAGDTELVNGAHANATFPQTGPDGRPLVDRFSDTADGGSARVPSNDPSAKVYPAVPQLTLAKFVCATGTGCEPMAQAPDQWVKTTVVPVGTDAEWTIAVTNTGTVDLADVALSSDILTNAAGDNVSDCEVGTLFGTGSLAVGASASLTCTTTNITSSEALINTAQAAGTSNPVNPDNPTQAVPAVASIPVMSNTDSARIAAGDVVVPTPSASSTSTVPAPDPSSTTGTSNLAGTGTDVMSIAAVATVLVALSGLALIAARRRASRG